MASILPSVAVPDGMGETAGVTTNPDPARINIRTRLAVAVIVLIGFSLTLVGATLAAVQRAAIEADVIERLWQDVEEFTVLANEGVDPQTGQRFDNPSRLLEVALQRTALRPTEGELGIVDGAARWSAPEAVALRPENDPQLMEHLLPLAELDTVSAGSHSTDITRYRYVVVPVVFEDSGERGALVRLFDLNAELADVRQVMLIYVLVALGSMVLVAGVTWLLAGRLLRPIEWLREAAEAIDEDDLTARVPVTGSDDLTRLSITMNGMLDRISDSVEAQRQLLDDVGHELRTPITVVRGHLELMDVNNPADVAATQTLAIDELDRMGGLVTDLLTLAKAERPDFVRLSPTDVAVLTDSTFEKARALGEHRWLLGEVADVEVMLDPARITQAWLQLASNADKYSDPGSVIELGSKVVGDEVHLWVRDEGIGIAPDQIDLIRSRFGRALAGRVQAEGVGLGLAIVGSIMRSHHGRLDISSAHGVGSRFTMVLPRSRNGKDVDEHDLDH